MIPGRPFSTASYESVGVVTPKSPIEGKDGIICMRHTYKRRRREGRTLIPAFKWEGWEWTQGFENQTQESGREQQRRSDVD